MKARVIKRGNSTLILNEDYAVKTQEEIDKILSNIARIRYCDWVKKQIMKERQEK